MEGGDQDDDDDELAFELSIQYQYFEGLCQIAVDHEKKRDATSIRWIHSLRLLLCKER